jgi:hypothetical protein
MKKNIIFIAFASLAFASCVGDLDQAPMSSNTIANDEVYSNPTYRKGQLAKIYGGFTLVGQAGAGSADIAVDDAGESEFLRAFWSIQTVSTDEAKVTWGNAWNTEMNKNSWTATKNSAVYATYTRGVMMVTFANEFLRNTSDDDPEVATERAEVRFLRAYAYWVLLDCFGNPPFTDETTPIGDFKSEQISAADLFAWLKGELEDLTSASSGLKEIHTQTYPRIDKGAAYALLARLCLNHKTYTGREDNSIYTDAMNAADKVIAAYPLATNFKALFMGDNGQNPDALKEMIYTACYDAFKTQSYGGPTFIIAASKNLDAYLGLKANWAGLVISSEFVTNLIGQGAVDGAKTGAEAEEDFSSIDARALVSLKISDDKEMTGTDFPKGWHGVKFNNNHFLDDGDYSQNESFASIDFPLMRSGEMYLAYAEAKTRIDGGTTSDAKAIGYIVDLRARAGASASTPATISLEDVFSETTKELFWEGQRRTILIRYDRYTSANYLWPLKGGVKQGQGIDDYRKLFPLPSDDLQANTNLVQNPGY